MAHLDNLVLRVTRETKGVLGPLGWDSLARQGLQGLQDQVDRWVRTVLQGLLDLPEVWVLPVRLDFLELLARLGPLEQQGILA